MICEERRVGTSALKDGEGIRNQESGIGIGQATTTTEVTSQQAKADEARKLN